MDGEEFEATLVIRIRPEYEGDHEALAKKIAQSVGTFMVDTRDWRFDELELDDRENIIEIFANVW